jgi:hypothetical protein
MKREIKFRAWNEEDKVMIEGDNLAFEQYAPLVDQLKSCKHIMQYTGLKDKNETEIYEGDFISNGHDTCLIIWRHDLASFALSKNGWAYDHYFGEAVDPGYVEVIGNKFQNSDLLRNK